MQSSQLSGQDHCFKSQIHITFGPFNAFSIAVLEEKVKKIPLWNNGTSLIQIYPYTIETTPPPMFYTVSYETKMH